MAKCFYSVIIAVIILLTACAKSGPGGKTGNDSLPGSGGGSGGGVTVTFTNSSYAGNSYYRRDYIQSGVGPVFTDSTYNDTVLVREASNNFIYFIRQPGDTLRAAKNDSNIYHLQYDFRTLITFRFTAPDSLKYFYSRNAPAATLDYTTISFKGKKQ